MESNFETLQQYDQLSPFEIKDQLITLADSAARKSASIGTHSP